MGRIYRFLGPDRRRHPARADRRRAAGRVRLRHHLRHEQRVRLRLPARQHEVRARALRAARAPLRDRRRGGQHPHRRGADAAHHLGPGRGVDRPLLRGRPDHPAAQGRARSRGATRRPRTARRSRRPATTSSTRSTRPCTLTESGMAKAEKLLGGTAAAGRALRPGQHAAAPPRRTRRCARTRSSSATSTTWSRTARSSSSTSSPAA